MTADNHFDEEKSGLQFQRTAPVPYIKARHILALMVFLGTFNAYAVRVNISVAIVGMVNTTSQVESGTVMCSQVYRNASVQVTENGMFNWNTAQQGLLLGAFYYGYLFSNILGAWLSKNFGFKLVMGTTIMLTGVLTICTPVSAKITFELAVFLRVAIGFLQGTITPSVVGLWEAWGPILERSVLTSFGLSGGSVGSLVTLLLGGVLVEELGWEALFYVTGSSGLLWGILWFALIHDTPEKHPRITEEEKKYILENRGEVDCAKKTKMEVPWRSILTSFPVAAIICSHFALNWMFYMLLTMLPTYMSTVLGFDIAMSGSLSALPYLLHWLFTFLGGYLVDVVRGRRLTSTVVVRKVTTTLGLAIPALFLVLTGYIGCDAPAAVAFLSLSVGFSALEIPGTVANTLDIAPKYAGIIYGVANTISSIPGFLAPQLVGLLLNDSNSLLQWQTIFWISAAISLVANIVFAIWGSGKEQSWAMEETIDEQQTNEPLTRSYKHTETENRDN